MKRIRLTLPYREPIRFDAIIRFLTERDQMPDVEIEFGNPLRVTAHSGDDIRVNRTFDLTADPVTIDAHLAKDKLLRPLLRERPGPRVPGAWNPFEVALRGIVGQQISVRAATTIMRRGDFTKGMPASRIATIQRFRDAYESDPSLLAPGASLDEAIERLTAIKGIGPWTAHYIAMRVIGHRDAFPHSDLGLKKAAATIGIDPEKLLTHAERWRPFRAYAAVALWESL
jgi:AraC family transcriptional regulator of adaptative response / DNA-3-methyladenine glycosylase II